jgi:hypothetical protein
MMAAFGVFSGYMCLMLARGAFSRPMLLAVTAVGGLAVVVSMGLMPDAVSSRLSFLGAEGNMNADSISSGRYSEGEHALDKLLDNPVAAITGFGLGSAITTDSLSYSTVHFSPLALAMQVGVPIAALFYLFLLYSIARFGSSLLRGGKSTTYFIVFLVAIGEVIFSMTAFTVLQSYTLWLAMAYLYIWRRPVEPRVSA